MFISPRWDAPLGFCHIQIDYQHRISGLSSRCGRAQTVNHKRGARFLLKNTILTCVDKLGVCEICQELLLIQGSWILETMEIYVFDLYLCKSAMRPLSYGD